MEEESKNMNQEKETLPSSEKMTIRRYCLENGIPTKDTTMEHLGKTLVMPLRSLPKEQDDSAETMMRYLNQRKRSQNNS